MRQYDYAGNQGTGLDTLVLMLERDMTVRWVSEGLERTTGWPAAEICGRSFDSIQRRLGLSLDVAQLEDTLANGRDWSADLTVRTHSRELRHIRAQVSAVRDAQDCVLGVLVTARDETELRQLRSVAEAVNLATNIGQMFAGIRHELGNPINSLKTALTVLRTNWRNFEPSHVDHYFNRMLVEVGRVEYLLRSLRSFSAFEDLRLRRVEIDNIMAEVARFVIRPAQERGITLRVEAEPNLVVGADERALYQIMLNLLTNAMDAIGEEGGTIQLCAGRLEDGSVALEVIDDGPGIPPGQLELICRPFFTTKSTGTGLGLTIVERLVVEMNGEFVIDSRPGRTAARVLLQDLPDA